MKNLSTRQRQIADLVAEGLTDAADRRAPGPQRQHGQQPQAAVYAKLNVHNAVQLVHALWKKDMS